MRNLLKALAAATLIGAGSTGLAAVAYLQTNPLALTTHRFSEAEFAEAAAPLDRLAYAAFLPVIAAGRQVADERSAAVTGQVTQTHRSAEPEAEPAPRRLVPCSDWLDMGPASLTHENGPERRRVKVLCPEGASASEYYDRNR